MSIKVILHAACDKPVAQLCESGLTAGELLELLMGYTAPLHPAVGILGFVELPHSTEAIHGPLQFLIGKINRVFLKLFLDQTHIHELLGNLRFLPDAFQVRFPFQAN